jgi:sigma-E factor negative regulatory protein RseC
MKESLGMKAILLGYFLPFVVLVTAVVVFINLGIKEGIAGVLSIATLAPYYLVLYLFKNKIQREFNFNIEKI